MLRLFLLLSLLTSLNCIIVNSKIKVCKDAEVLDLTNSCEDGNNECVQEKTYLKNFQDFDDFYIHSKGQIYHVWNDVIYIQSCEITTKFNIPGSFDECETRYQKDIPCTYLDNLGTNKSGFFTQYEIIRVSMPIHRAKRNHSTKKCKKLMTYSLPDGKNQIIKNGKNLSIKPIARIGKILEDVVDIDNEHEINSFIDFVHNDVYNIINFFVSFTLYIFYVLLIILLILFKKKISNFLVKIKGDFKPDLTLKEIEKLKVAELRTLCQSYGFEIKNKKKNELLELMKTKVSF